MTPPVIHAPRLLAEPVPIATSPAAARAAAGPAGTTGARVQRLPVLQAVATPPVDLAAELDRQRAALQAQWAQERDAVLAQAHAEGLAQGRADGLVQGQDDGRRQAQAAVAERLRALDAVLATTRQRCLAEIDGAHDTLAALAFEAVCRILGPAAPTAAGVAGMVQALLKEVPARTPLRLALHPADAALLAGQRSALGLADGPDGVLIEADAQVVLGGCLVQLGQAGQGAGATLDGRLEAQLQQLRQVLLAARADIAAGAPPGVAQPAGEGGA